MSADSTTDPPPYIIPVEGKGADVKVYHVHTPFNPPSTTENIPVSQEQGNMVYTSGGTKNKFVSYETELGRSAGMTTCASCQQQVMTNVHYKIGCYAWLMCFVFILFGLGCIGACLLPFFLKHFKDVHHSCPRCHRVLHVEKKRCCK